MQKNQTTIKKCKNYLYSLNHEIGRGTQGVVYQGRRIDDPEKKNVAIKRVQIPKDSQPWDVAAMQTEIFILKYLKDDHVIQCHDIYHNEKWLFIIMEFADGGNLYDYLRNQGPLSEEKVIKYMKQIVCGMGIFVKNGIMHRDLKPMNILIVNGKLKIADFGLSCFSSISQKMMNRVGTEYYMSPQVLNHNPYSSKCDIWSLGVIAYQMITGTIPWGNSKSISDRLKVMQKFTNNEVPFPPEIVISKELKGFIQGCLEYEERKRFGWVEVFLHKIFEGKFKKAVLINDNYSPKFLFSQLRLKINLQNINLQEEFEKLPDTLSYQDFTVILQAINPEFSNKDIKEMFQYVSKNDQLLKDNFLEYLSKIKVNVKGKSIEQMQKISGKFTNNVGRILEHLSQKIKLKKLDLFDLFQTHNSNGLEGLSPQKFNQIILTIDPTFPTETLPELLTLFDLNRDGKISYEELYTQFCKIGQIIAIRNKNMMDSFRKMVTTKEYHKNIIKSAKS